MQEHRDDPLLQRLLGHELDLLLRHPFCLLVERLDPVVRVDQPSEAFREIVKAKTFPAFPGHALSFGRLGFRFATNAAIADPPGARNR